MAHRLFSAICGPGTSRDCGSFRPLWNEPTFISVFAMPYSRAQRDTAKLASTYECAYQDDSYQEFTYGVDY